MNANAMDSAEKREEACQPEDLINQVVGMNAKDALRWLDQLAGTESALDLSRLNLIPGEINETTVKVKLLDYLGGIDHPDAALQVCRFLDDDNRVVRFEALKALGRYENRFDLSTVLAHIESMSSSEEALALKLVGRHANSELVGKLAEYSLWSTPRLKNFFSRIVVDHADVDSLGRFLERLGRVEESLSNEVIATLQKCSNENFLGVAGYHARHEDHFVRACARLLGDIVRSDQDIARIETFALSAHRQTRQRAIRSIGKSENRKGIAILKKVARAYPEDSAAVLQAVTQLGFSKGLEVALNCLSNTDPEIQIAALETIEAIVTEKHAESIRENLVEGLSKQSGETHRRACSLVQVITRDFSLTKIQLDGLETVEIPSPQREVDCQEDTDTSSIVSPLDSLEVGSVWLDRFLIVREIGSGMMGKVMLAEDDYIGEQLVLKFMHSELVSDANLVERFKREVKYARRISHDNVIRVHDLLIRDELCAISMAYFDSRGLDVILKNTGGFDERDGLKILYQVSNGMSSAHDQGVIHRDLKPSNILVNETGLVKVVDFGIASATGGLDSTLTRTGSVVGSPAYIARKEPLVKTVAPGAISIRWVSLRTTCSAAGCLTRETPWRCLTSIVMEAPRR